MADDVTGCSPSPMNFLLSYRTKLLVPYRSSLARDYIRLLDYFREVAYFVGLPSIWLDDTERVYSPDFVVHTRECRSLVICDVNSGLPSEADIDTWNSVSRWCERSGYSFCRITPDGLYAGHRLDNVKQLELFRDETVTVEEEELALAAVRSASKPIPVQRVIQALRSLGFERAVEVVMNMVYRHKLTFPVDRTRLSLSTPLSLPPPLGGLRDRWVDE